MRHTRRERRFDIVTVNTLIRYVVSLAAQVDPHAEIIPMIKWIPYRAPLALIPIEQRGFNAQMEDLS